MRMPALSEAQLPQAADVERTVLGMMLLRELAYYEITSAGLTADYFIMDSHRRIYRSIQRLVESKKTPDVVTVCDEVERQKELDVIGGAAYLGSLLDGVPDSGGNAAEYVEILREKYLRRATIQGANRLLTAAYDLSDPIKWTIAGTQDDLLRLQGEVTHGGYSIKDFDAQVFGDVQDQMYGDKEIIGLPFGIRELDDVTTGMRDGEFIPLGGYSGSAKTAFACNVARVNAVRGTPSGFFSIEMSKEQLLHRFWAQASDIPHAHLRNPKNLPKQEFTELREHWMPEVRKWPIKIDDRTKDIRQMIPLAHLWVKRHGVKLIVVDYLQRVHAPGKGEYEQVSYSADALTEFAKETKVPVLCLSQLSRPEGRGQNAANIPPTMGQLRNSGHIEQNAHLVLFTHRPEDENGQPTGEDVIIIGKQRAGVKRWIKVYFDGSSQRWEERTAESPKQEVQTNKRRRKQEREEEVAF